LLVKVSRLFQKSCFSSGVNSNFATQFLMIDLMKYSVEYHFVAICSKTLRPLLVILPYAQVVLYKIITSIKLNS